MRETPKAFVAAYAKHGSIKAVARNEGLSWGKARGLYKAAVEAGLMAPQPVGRKSSGAVKAPEPQGRLGAMRPDKLDLPPAGKINKYLFTCAQNDTLLHSQLWDNLKRLAEHYDEDPSVHVAQIHIARLTYVRAGMGAKGDKAAILTHETLYGGKEMTWPSELEPYFSDKRTEVAPGLVWCGEVNIIPTADRPLSGFESYTGRKSGIFPHSKFAMESIASMADEGTKFNYTTGAITQRNHIQRKAGLKADFHHGYGALLAEVDSAGNWWCRQLVADNAGTIYDLDLRVEDGAVEQGEYIDTIVWGDIHVSILDVVQRELIWGEGGLLDRLQPSRQVLHDVLNTTARSHHEARDPMKRFLRFSAGQENMEEEVLQAAIFLEESARSWCDTVVVNSNHDRHLGRWLKDEDGRYDPVNAQFWAALWTSALTTAAETAEEPNYFELALDLVPQSIEGVVLLPRDASYVVCPDDAGGIECGLHGDEGANGSRGSARGFAKMGRRMVVGHTHSAGILDGVYTVGTHSILRPDYTHGPGSWSNTFCVIYENGKRSLVTIWDDRERA